jgi:uncharacterized protein DUF1707
MSNNRTTRRPAAAKAPPKDDGLYLEVFDGKYKVATQVGIWPLMQFARAAETGTALTDHRGLAACHAFLEQVIDPADWARFQDDMIRKRVNDLDALLAAARQAVDALYTRQQSNGRARPAAGNGQGRSRAALPPPDQGKIRAADADRDRVIEQLNTARSDGRLDPDEHQTRLDAALAAKTMGERAPLTADLPGAPAPGD